MRWLSFIMGVFLTACALPPTTTSDPLLYDPAQTGRAETVVIGIPGALTPITVLSPMERFRTSRRAVVYYRLPGFDGRPGEEAIDIGFAADRITRFVQENALSRVHLIGHSTGAAIAFESAIRIRSTLPETEVQVAAISSALPAPQPTLAGIRGGLGTLAAAARVGSLNPRKVWLEYYRVLAYGRGSRRTQQVAAAADQLVAANEGRIEIPQDGLARRHWAAIRRWPGPEVEALEGVPVTFFHGAGDPVFPLPALRRFSVTLPDAKIIAYQDNGHLLFLSYPQVWQDVSAAFGF